MRWQASDPLQGIAIDLGLGHQLVKLDKIATRIVQHGRLDGTHIGWLHRKGNI